MLNELNDDNKKQDIRAVGLVSGGLDSVLAAKALIDQGIKVIGVHFITPFNVTPWEKESSGNIIEEQAAEIGFQYYPCYLGREYIELIKNPRWGHGSQINPCIDCHIYFLRKAKEIMEDEGAQFVFTGEVTGQRPMSQNRPTLRMIEKRSGLEGYLLRPLCAKKLEPTIPEDLGWVNRERLLDIHGRGRKIQLALAEQYGIKNYETPAGGCQLTDPEFSHRLRELFDHDTDDIENIRLLKVGRHFRLGPKTKLIVGRSEKDNRVMADMALDQDVLFEAEGGGSPLSILRGDFDESMIRTAAAITRRYSRARNHSEIPVRVRRSGSDQIDRIVPEIPDEEEVRSRLIRRPRS